MTTQSGAGRVATPTSAHKASTASRDRSAAAAVVVAFATLMLAAGGARRDWLVVRECPICGFPHRHVAFETNPQAVERAPSCAPWRRYLVRVVDVVPPRRRVRRAA